MLGESFGSNAGSEIDWFFRSIWDDIEMESQHKSNAANGLIDSDDDDDQKTSLGQQARWCCVYVFRKSRSKEFPFCLGGLSKESMQNN